jgi:hypothetical protein
MKVKDDLVKNDKAKTFKLILIGCKIIFTPLISTFDYSLLLQYGVKNLKTKPDFFLIFRFKPKSLNDFIL